MQVKPAPPIDNTYLQNNPLLLAPKGLNVPTYTNIIPEKLDHKGFVKSESEDCQDIKAQFVTLKPQEKENQNSLDIVQQVLPTETSLPFKVLYERPPMLKPKQKVDMHDVFKNKVTYNHKNAVSKVRPMLMITNEPNRALRD